MVFLCPIPELRGQMQPLDQVAHENYRFEDGAIVLFSRFSTQGRYQQEDRVVPLDARSTNVFVSALGEEVRFLPDANMVQVRTKDGMLRVGERVEPYRVEDVAFRNGEVSLRGSLLLPAGVGPHPAVVFAHGAGKVTRHDLWGLADRFARRGIAALVYDKRGAGQSTGSYGGLIRDYGALADDLLAGVRLLKTRSDIDRRGIGVQGASEGGLVVPVAASRSSDVAFVIAVSAPGDRARQGLWSIENNIRYARLPNDALGLARRASFVLAGAARTLAAAGVGPRCCREPSFPAPVWEKVDQPVLLVYGELDKEVPPALSARMITAALVRGGNERYTVRVFASANHAIQMSKEGGFMAELYKPGPRQFAPGYLEALTDWVRTRMAGAASKTGHGWNPERVEPIADLDHPPWHASAAVQLGLWALFMAVFVGSCVGRLLIRVLPRTRRWTRLRRSPRVRRAQMLAAGTCALHLAVIAGMVVVFAQFFTVEPSGWLWRGLRALAWISVLTAASLVVSTRRAWSDGSWSRRARVHHAIVLATASGFVPFLIYWHVLA